MDTAREMRITLTLIVEKKKAAAAIPDLKAHPLNAGDKGNHKLPMKQIQGPLLTLSVDWELWALGYCRKKPRHQFQINSMV